MSHDENMVTYSQELLTLEISLILTRGNCSWIETGLDRVWISCSTVSCPRASPLSRPQQTTTSPEPLKRHLDLLEVQVTFQKLEEMLGVKQISHSRRRSDDVTHKKHLIAPLTANERTANS